MSKNDSLSGVLDDFPRGDPGKDIDQYRPPETLFASPEGITKHPALEFSKDGIFLGLLNASVVEDKTSDGKAERYTKGGTPVGIRWDDRHMMTIAGSRSGKGRCAIIPNMLTYRGSVLAIDPKGELALHTAKHRADRLGQKVVVIDPFGTTLDHSKSNHDPLTDYRQGFNPMAFMDSESLVEDAVLIADALVMPEGSDPHWDESARTFIEGVIVEVATANRFKKNIINSVDRRNLVTVRDLIVEGDSCENPETGETVSRMDVLDKYMRKSSQKFVRRAAADFFDRPDRERGSVSSTARRHLRAINFPVNRPENLGGLGV